MRVVFGPAVVAVILASGLPGCLSSHERPGGSDDTAPGIDNGDDQPTVVNEGDAGGANGRKYPGPCIEEQDTGTDGMVDQRVTYIYDDDGNVLIEERDGTVYGDSGLPEPPDGAVDERTTYTYDADGNVLTEQRDENA